MSYSKLLERYNYDVVVVGGGSGGVGAALSSARHGARTALIQDRPVLGGNNSSEIRMHISGADAHALRKNARETGIVEELALKNRKYNPQNSFCVSDTIYWEMATFQPNLELYLNTRITGVEMENAVRIKKACGFQLGTEKEFEFSARIFVDATGDGYIAALSNAEYMYGRESRETFGEPHGLEAADNCTMGNSLMFTTIDMGRPVKFIKPDWANTYKEEDLIFRKHSSGEAIWRAKAGVDSGYWWIELGGRDDNVIFDGESIRDGLLKALYGVWDHIKNGGDHGAENLMLDWVGFVPGKRESRRIVGDYILVEQDLMETHTFDDAVAYGGWTIDRHTMGGIANLTDDPAHLLTPPDVYQIPYRCYYSKNIENLMMAGRNISCSHLAMASTRVMGTCMAGGQAVGAAAAIAVRENVTPREVGRSHIKELQQMLLNDDCYIPNLRNEDEGDFARGAKISASSSQKGFGPEKIINGVHRGVKDEPNLWKSDGIGKNGEWVRLEFGKEIGVRQVVLRFDSDLSQEIFVSINKMQLLDQVPGIPATLVKDYGIEFINKGKTVVKMTFQDNAMRYVVHTLDKIISCDTIVLSITATNGDSSAGLFEIRVY